MFDESSDIFGPALLCTHVRYIKDGEFQTKLLSINELGSEATGESLEKIVMEEIFPKEKELLLKENLIGICSDKGPNMLSKEKGLANRLVKKFKHVVAVHDYSHCFNLVVKYASLKFPQEIKDLVKSISTHFKRSSLRRAAFIKIQKDFGQDEVTDFLQVLTFVPTRWTSFLKSSQRILLLWTTLEIYFDQEKDEDVCTKLTPENELYLKLLVCLLEKLNSFIVYFESDNRDFSSIIPKLQQTFLLWGKMVIKPELFETITQESIQFSKLFELKFDNKNELKKFLITDKEFEDLVVNKYTGFDSLEIRFSSDFINKLFQSAKEFVIEVLVQMKNRFPFNNKVIMASQVLHFETNHCEHDKWILLSQSFPNIVSPHNYNSFINQLDLFESNFTKMKQSFGDGRNFLSFWNNLDVEEYSFL